MTHNERALADLKPNPDNPRQGVREDPAFLDLIASIESEGIIQPLLIDETNKILAGHRRYFAAQILGLERVPVHVLKSDAPHLIPLIENLQRLDLGVMEAADYFLKCHREFHMAIAEISRATGVSASTISNYIKLAEAQPELRARIDRDEIPLNAAFELLKHDAELIQELVKLPRLTKDIVKARARFGTVGSPKTNESWEKERDEHQKPIIDKVLLEKIYDRIESGCYTPEDISRCDHCGSRLFPTLGFGDIKRYVDFLIAEGRVRDGKRGSAKKIITPTDDLGSFRGAVNSFQRQPTARTKG